jgi:BASS family bile acid:Na+ symporter
VIDFNPTSLLLLNGILALMMLGVSLSLKADDFIRIIRAPAAPVVGLIAQFVLLPAVTGLLVWSLSVPPELALGMMLVASCPGGTFSNIMTWLGRANVAVSVSMTAVSSLAATVLMPLNFALYAWLNPSTRELMVDIAIEPTGILTLVAIVLGLPLLAGMLIGKHFPTLAQRAEKPLRVISLLVLLLFVGIAFGRNMDIFVTQFSTFFWLVVAHNLVALALGNVSGRLARLPVADRRAVTMEVGIQNSGLGLAVIFTFFPQASGMMVIAAFWGVWHLVSGLLLALIWSKGHLRHDES